MEEWGLKVPWALILDPILSFHRSSVVHLCHQRSECVQSLRNTRSLATIHFQSDPPHSCSRHFPSRTPSRYSWQASLVIKSISIHIKKILNFFFSQSHFFSSHKKKRGPVSPVGYQPSYKENGVACYLITNFLLISLSYFGAIDLVYVYDILGERKLTSECKTPFAFSIKNFLSAVILMSSLAALVLCFFLYLKGKYFPSSGDVHVTSGFKYSLFFQ